MQERCEALVLRGVDFSQSSRIVTFLCPDRGRMPCIVKGVRRPRNVLAGLLDTFRRLEIVYIWKDSRRVQQLTDCSLLEAYTGVRDDLDKSMYAALPLEIADTVAHDNEPSQELYACLVAGLKGLDAWRGDVPSYCAWFVLRLLTVSGFAPAVRSCCSCGEDIAATYRFSAAGGMTCSRCAHDATLSAEDFQALVEFSEGEGACPQVQAGPGLFQALAKFASHQLERDMRSARVLEQMFGTPGTARRGAPQ